jgi:hypothetical protein
VAASRLVSLAPNGASLRVDLSAWQLSDRADPAAKRLADRHYNRQNPDAAQFVPPGRCIVLLAEDALWVSSWPFAEYVRHAWAGAWVCSAFRNEGARLSSELIREAVAATLAFWEPPALGMVTFVDASKTRRKRDPGRCFRKAGFRHVGFTKSGLYALQLLPVHMPAPCAPLYSQTSLLTPDVQYHRPTRSEQSLEGAAVNGLTPVGQEATSE